MWMIPMSYCPNRWFLDHVTFIQKNNNKKHLPTFFVYFGSNPSNPCHVAWPFPSDWHPGQVLPLQVQEGSDTCVPLALRAPLALHIHQPVSHSAGRFIINSCWLVKSGPGHGVRPRTRAHPHTRTHTDIFIFTAKTLLPWVDFKGHEPILFAWMMDTHPKAEMHPHWSRSQHPVAVSLFLSWCLTHEPKLCAFCLHVKNFCAVRPGREKRVCKCGASAAGPLPCVFVMPV